MLKNFMGGGFSFAHLAGLSSASKGKDLRDQHEEDARAHGAAAETSEDEEDEEEADEPSEDKRGKKRGKKTGAEDEGEDEEASSEGEDDGDEEAEEDDDEEVETSEKDEGKKGGKKAAKPAVKPAAKNDKASFKRGRKAERRRVGLILSSPAAAGNIQLATRLACNTGMSSSAAIALLESTPAARGGSLNGRMQDQNVPKVTNGAPAPTGAAAIAASWDVATKDFQ